MHSCKKLKYVTCFYIWLILSPVKKVIYLVEIYLFLYLSTCLSHWRKYQFYESMDTFEISQCTLKKSRSTIYVVLALIISTISFICFCFVTPSQSIVSHQVWNEMSLNRTVACVWSGKQITEFHHAYLDNETGWDKSLCRYRLISRFHFKFHMYQRTFLKTSLHVYTV